MDKATLTKLRVKVGVLRRAVKEHAMYTDEVAQLTAKGEELGPEHDRYRQNAQALDESKAMVLDVANRVADAREDLSAFLDTETVEEAEELCKEARKLIADAEALSA